MITFFDLLQNDDFRGFVKNRIAANTEEPYSFPKVFPLLYRYRSLSSYSIDDIMKKQITLTSIGEFNDIFDGAFHQYGTKEKIEEAAEKKWSEIEALRIKAHLPDDLLQKNSIIYPFIEHLKTESRRKFRELDYLGTYVCCFSKDNSSTLMWAHYADANKGLCIEYDFNRLPSESFLRKTIFPIAYTSKPIDVSDLLTDIGNRIYQYPLDAAVLCTALNKASMWQYEQEWRIVCVLAPSSGKDRRLAFNSYILPSKVYLGYHFLKPFFYYKNEEPEYKNCAESIKRFMNLISYLQNNEIKVAVMVPLVGSYQFTSCDISIDELHEIMCRFFHDGEPKNMRYYYVIHDYLMDLIEKNKG